MRHAGDSTDDLYDKIKEDVQFRKTWAEEAGFGFELPLSCTECTEKRRRIEVVQGSVNS
jgi:hypothetical protein